MEQTHSLMEVDVTPRRWWKPPGTKKRGPGPQKCENMTLNTLDCENMTLNTLDYRIFNEQ